MRKSSIMPMYCPVCNREINPDNYMRQHHQNPFCEISLDRLKAVGFLSEWEGQHNDTVNEAPETKMYRVQHSVFLRE